MASFLSFAETDPEIKALLGHIDELLGKIAIVNLLRPCTFNDLKSIECVITVCICLANKPPLPMPPSGKPPKPQPRHKLMRTRALKNGHEKPGKPSKK